jgi:mannitol-1-phosphate/altronate dehydrogenase
MDFGAKVDPEFPKWVEENIKFPNSKVERIASAYNYENSTKYLKHKYLYNDKGAVATEGSV